MGLKEYRKKLVGDKDERAVSPVIGVILMVAITVILAAVIAAFVLDLGDDMGSGPTNAAVGTDVSDSDREISFTLNDKGDADTFEVRGDSSDLNGTPSGYELSLENTGDSDTLAYNDSELELEGDLRVVAIDGDSESIVADVEWDFN